MMNFSQSLTCFVNENFNTLQDLDDTLKAANLFDDSFILRNNSIYYMFTPKNHYSSFKYYSSVPADQLLKILQKVINLKAFI